MRMSSVRGDNCYFGDEGTSVMDNGGIDCVVTTMVMLAGGDDIDDDDDDDGDGTDNDKCGDCVVGK